VRFTSAFAKGSRKNQMEIIVVAIIALLLFAYLFVAMIRPEKF
jgi:K+-transporting ATPase KdpF subunit